MLKKILYTVLFIVLAAGAFYSWQKVDFNRKTAMFFQVVFGGENSMGGPGGRPPMGENRGGDMSRPEPPAGQASGPGFQGGSPSGPSEMAEGGERGASSDFGRGENPGNRPAGNGGPGGHGAPGGNISLGNVAKFTVIMAFFVMLTRLLDRLVHRMKQFRQSV